MPLNGVAAQPRRVPVAGVAVDGAAGHVPRGRGQHRALARAVRARRAQGPRAHGPGAHRRVTTRTFHSFIHSFIHSHNHTHLILSHSHKPILQFKFTRSKFTI